MKKVKTFAHPIYFIGDEKREFVTLLKQGKHILGLRTGRLIITALKQLLNSKGDTNGSTTKAE